MKRLTAYDATVLPFPPELIYTTLCDFGSYPEWWPRDLHVQAIGPLPTAPGTQLRLGNGAFARWTATVTELEENALIEMRYSDGACSGYASWTLVPVENGTRLAYKIDIMLDPLWLRLAAMVVNLANEHTKQIDKLFASLHERIEQIAAAAPGVPPEPVAAPQPVAPVTQLSSPASESE